MQIQFQKFKTLIENELRRKERFGEWQQSYIETNNDLKEPKELIREESRRTLELSVSPQPERETDSRKRMESVKDEKRRSIVRSKYVQLLFDEITR